jgi:hypothetical protein
VISGRSARIALTLLVIAGAVEQGCARRAVEKNTRQTFEQGDEGWIGFGADARVEVVHDSSQVKNGRAALALHYEFIPGQYGSAVLPLETGELSALTRLRFWIKVDHPTSVIVVLSEKQPGGGYYSSWFWCPSQQWIEVSLTPQDFVLNQGPTDPVDRNGRLDLDDVRGIGLSDLGQAFQTLGTDPTYPLIVDKVTGTHTINVDDFEFVSSAGAALSGPWTDKRIGRPERRIVTWITLGADLRVADAASPLREPGFSASYQQTFGRYVAISHTLLDHDLRGVQKLSVVLASASDANLMVYLEEKKPGTLLGPRYSHPHAIAGGSKPTRVDLTLSEFQPDATGMTDPNGKLDADLLKSISIVDITAADSRPPKANTLWISPITGR